MRVHACTHGGSRLVVTVVMPPLHGCFAQNLADIEFNLVESTAEGLQVSAGRFFWFFAYFFVIVCLPCDFYGVRCVRAA